jgi:hypothetical protein
MLVCGISVGVGVGISVEVGAGKPVAATVGGSVATGGGVAGAATGVVGRLQADKSSDKIAPKENRFRLAFLISSSRISVPSKRMY